LAAWSEVIAGKVAQVTVLVYKSWRLMVMSKSVVPNAAEPGTALYKYAESRFKQDNRVHTFHVFIFASSSSAWTYAVCCCRCLMNI